MHFTIYNKTGLNQRGDKTFAAFELPHEYLGVQYITLMIVDSVVNQRSSRLNKAREMIMLYILSIAFLIYSFQNSWERCTSLICMNHISEVTKRKLKQ